MLDQNRVLQDRYVIDRKLGQGGMGAVYLATDRRFGTTVALKQTLVAGDTLTKAFEREARLLNKLRHAALPVVIDYFAEHDGQFLVMQFIPGKDFGELLATRTGPFPIADVLRWADSLLDALDYLHGQDPPVVHRDIKPQNLKLTPRGEIVLLDFGLAKGAAMDPAQAASTGTSVFGYTPHYAPFEQVKGSGTDTRSDLYSLAATIYHLATACVPPDAMTRAEAAMLRKQDPIAFASDVNPEIPVGVAEVLRKALAMDRDERFATAAEMRAALYTAEEGTVFRLPDSKTRMSGAPTSAGFPTIPEGTTVAAGSGSMAPSLSPSNPSPIPPAAETIRQEAETQAIAAPRRRPLPWIAAAVVAVAAVAGGVWFTAFRNPTPAAPAAPDPDYILTAPPLDTFVFETASLTPKGEIVDRKQMTGQAYTIDIGDATMEIVRVPGGSYDRGSPDTEAGRFADEGPVAKVTIAEFYIGKYEVTQAQWRAVAALPKVRIDLPADPSEFKGDTLPVENVTWEQANEFCARLSRRTHRFYRLPSETEWEYACRAGTSTPYSFGETITTEVANYNGQVGYGVGPTGARREKTMPVGSFKIANAFGLYDMYGNVREWCFGQYHDTWAGAPTDGSSWLEGGDNRLRSCKGGAWDSLAPDCRSAARFGLDVYHAPKGIGFRVLMRPGKGDAWALAAER
jgi:formylglycine-generating enzyme required for sulfatase activity